MLMDAINLQEVRHPREISISQEAYTSKEHTKKYQLESKMVQHGTNTSNGDAGAADNPHKHSALLSTLQILPLLHLKGTP